ncbi:hypothetical protein B296_00056545 [Ensete ventricosum]|uniref:Uncharacterized protein n=1 Tax=Ensete ventricosum TaxID=4639 RepID=A0A426XDG6_ENSVE|nr:hypothetical protein B296_00056545 [Ensete ventricosum]
MSDHTHRLVEGIAPIKHISTISFHPVGINTLLIVDQRANLAIRGITPGKLYPDESLLAGLDRHEEQQIHANSMLSWTVSDKSMRLKVALDWMGGDSELGSGSRLLEWWSSGQEEVLQLGPVVRVSALPASGRSYDHLRANTCARLASHVGLATSAGQLSEAGRRGGRVTIYHITKNDR